MQRLNIQQARTLEQHSQHLCVNVVAAFFSSSSSHHIRYN